VELRPSLSCPANGAGELESKSWLGGAISSVSTVASEHAGCRWGHQPSSAGSDVICGKTCGASCNMDFMPYLWSLVLFDYTDTCLSHHPVVPTTWEVAAKTWHAHLSSSPRICSSPYRPASDSQQFRHPPPSSIRSSVARVSVRRHLHVVRCTNPRGALMIHSMPSSVSVISASNVTVVPHSPLGNACMWSVIL
jgi:hypothetical protein